MSDQNGELVWPYLPWRVEESDGRKLDAFQIMNTIRHKVAYVGGREIGEFICQAVNAGGQPLPSPSEQET